MANNKKIQAEELNMAKKWAREATRHSKLAEAARVRGVARIKKSMRGEITKLEGLGSGINAVEMSRKRLTAARDAAIKSSAAAERSISAGKAAIKSSRRGRNKKK